MNVLLVASDPVLKARVLALLRARGDRVAWSSSYEGALRLLQSEDLDVVMLETHYDLSAHAGARPVIVLRTPFRGELVAASLDALAKLDEETQT